MIHCKYFRMKDDMLCLEKDQISEDTQVHQTKNFRVRPLVSVQFC